MSERFFPAGLLLLAALGAVGGGGPVEPDDFISITTLSGDATLAAAISLPSGDGPFPAVVFVHGSGRVTRQDLEGNAETLQSIGFASLRYDKRGVGQSTGVYIPVGAEDSKEVFSVLADDVLAAVQYLTSRPEIDPMRIGVMGGSQAGWIMPAREVDTGRLAAELAKMLAESSTRCSRSTTSSSPISFHAPPPTNLCGASCALDTCVRRKHAGSEFEQA